MQIVMVSGHACIRVQKISLPLIQDGHKVHLIARKVPSLVENYASFHLYRDVEQLINTIKLFEHADIFHCHNEPSWFVAAIKEIFPNKPVILDVHDTYLTRISPEEHDRRLEHGEYPIRITAEERLNIQLADGLVHVSEKVRDVVDREFAPNVPSVILPSYLPRMFYCYDLKEWLGGLVYEGKVTLPEEVKSKVGATGFEYCDYMELARQAKEIKLDFHLYPARNDKEFLAQFDELAYCHPPVSFNTLIKVISRHDWGLVGNAFYTQQWDHALPNKLFDYMAACVPAVAMNASVCSEFLKEHGVGIAVDSVKELASRWAEHRECREQLVKKRQQFCMEENNQCLKDLYGGMV